MSRRGALRASDADREACVDRLRRAATEGRIAPEEFEQRVSVALSALTYAELESTLADLPGPERPRGRSRHPAVPAARWALGTVRAHPALLFVLIPALAVTAAMMIAAMVLWATLIVVAMVLGHRGGPWIGPGNFTLRRRSGGWDYRAIGVARTRSRSSYL